MSIAIGAEWLMRDVRQPMIRPILYSFSMGLLLTGCSTGVKHVSPSKFQRDFTSSQTVAMQHYIYTGETNGCVYISRITCANWWYYSKLKWQTVFTETNDLPSEFLQYVRQTKPLPSGPATNYVGKPKAERLPAGNTGFRQGVHPGPLVRRA